MDWVARMYDSWYNLSLQKTHAHDETGVDMFGRQVGSTVPAAYSWLC